MRAAHRWVRPDARATRRSVPHNALLISGVVSCSLHLGRDTDSRSTDLRKTNYSFQKRQRDLAKQQKRDAKREKKLLKDREVTVDGSEAAPATDDAATSEPAKD